MRPTFGVDSEAEARDSQPEREALREVAKIVQRHTHQGAWAMTRYAGPSPEDDCLLCRALVAAGVLTLDQIGSGTRALLESDRGGEGK